MLPDRSEGLIQPWDRSRKPYAELSLDRPTVSVVIPALNEARNLPHVLPLLPDCVDEVILVDGASTDDTVAVASQLVPSIRIVGQEGPGKGAALCAGLAAASCEIVVMLDADGSTDPREIPSFVDALVAGADFVKGSRFMPDGGSTDISRLRAFGNGFFVLLVRILFGARYTDLCYGYNALWRRHVSRLGLDSVGFEIETVMNVRALTRGLRVSEVPSFEHPRIYGSSNLRPFRDGLRILRTILRERLSVAPSFVAAEEPGGYGVPIDAPDLVPVMSRSADRLVAIPIDAGDGHAGASLGLEESWQKSAGFAPSALAFADLGAEPEPARYSGTAEA